MKHLDADRLRQILHYDPETGIFTWRVAKSRKYPAGSTAGCDGTGGYRLLSIDYCKFKANRLAWLYMHGTWPDGNVDHIDGDPSNDRWINLRLANRSQNAGNMKMHSDNTSGFKGVHYRKKESLWTAAIMVRGKRIHLGCFLTPELAHAAYVAAAKEHFGEFARAA